MFKKIIFYSSFVLMFLCFLTTSSSAATYPDVPKLGYNQEYIIFKDYNGVITMHLFYLDEDKANNIKFFINDNGSLCFKNTGSYNINLAFYKLKSDGTKWSSSGSTSYAPGYVGTTPTTGSFSFIETSLNVYASEDSTEVFFPLPPTSMTVEEIIAVETPKAGEKVIQTMNIILLCGVGCLALLISLPLFGKALLRWVAR